MVSNVFYGKKSRESISRSRLHEWINNSLSPRNNEGIISRMDNYAHVNLKNTDYDKKGRPITKEQQSKPEQPKQEQSQMKTSYTDDIESRFRRAKAQAGLL